MNSSIYIGLFLLFPFVEDNKQGNTAKMKQEFLSQYYTKAYLKYYKKASANYREFMYFSKEEKIHKIY